MTGNMKFWKPAATIYDSPVRDLWQNFKKARDANDSEIPKFDIIDRKSSGIMYSHKLKSGAELFFFVAFKENPTEKEFVDTMREICCVGIDQFGRGKKSFVKLVRTGKANLLYREIVDKEAKKPAKTAPQPTIQQSSSAHQPTTQGEPDLSDPYTRFLLVAVELYKTINEQDPNKIPNIDYLKRVCAERRVDLFDRHLERAVRDDIIELMNNGTAYRIKNK